MSTKKYPGQCRFHESNTRHDNSIEHEYHLKTKKVLEENFQVFVYINSQNVKLCLLFYEEETYFQ